MDKIIARCLFVLNKSVLARLSYVWIVLDPWCPNWTWNIATIRGLSCYSYYQQGLYLLWFVKNKLTINMLKIYELLPSLSGLVTIWRQLIGRGFIYFKYDMKRIPGSFLSLFHYHVSCVWCSSNMLYILLLDFETDKEKGKDNLQRDQKIYDNSK